MSEFCKRHKWAVDREFLADFPLPNGRPSGEQRWYQVRKCVNCPATTSAWKKEPNQVVRTRRQVIEKRLLDGLNDGAHVAILCSEQDLTLIIDALRECTPGWDCKAKGFLDGLKQLRKEAFGK